VDEFVKNQYDHPLDKFKVNWDIFMSFVLIFISIVTPYRIAFVAIDSQGWHVANIIVDSVFLIDIIIIFNTAYFDEDYKLVQDRKLIAKGYLSSWFAFDFLAVVPFDLLLRGQVNDYSDLIRLSRIGRLYRLLKLTKLLKIGKALQNRVRILEGL
jgi:hypothetical protein